MGDDEQIVAVVRYQRARPTAGEVASIVEDCWQGRDIASTFLYRPAEHACGRGFVESVAHAMGWNTRMRTLLRHGGFPAVSYVVDGMTAVRLYVSRPPATAGAR